MGRSVIKSQSSVITEHYQYRTSDHGTDLFSVTLHELYLPLEWVDTRKKNSIGLHPRTQAFYSTPFKATPAPPAAAQSSYKQSVTQSIASIEFPTGSTKDISFL